MSELYGKLIRTRTITSSFFVGKAFLLFQLILQDLTTGINCEKCIANYYRPHDVLPNAQDPCVPCECNPNGSVGVCNNIGGTCTCRTGFAGQFCEQCAAGYNGENCEKCACNAKGTMPGGECESHCQCKVSRYFELSGIFSMGEIRNF